MVLSSRDRRYVVVEMVWLGPSLERRRLRFSFQFNDVKDRSWLSPAPLFSAGGRRRRLSRGPPLPCQSPVSALCEKVPKPLSLEKVAPHAGARTRTNDVRERHRPDPRSDWRSVFTASVGGWQGESGAPSEIVHPPGRRKASRGPVRRRSLQGVPPRRSGPRPASRFRPTEPRQGC